MAKPLLLEGLASTSTDDSLEVIQQLRNEKIRLEEELIVVHRELDDANREKERAERSLRNLRQQLSPLHRALRAVFGEIELAVGEENQAEPPRQNSPGVSNNASASRWDAIKSRLTKKQAELIDVLLMQGRMNRTQCAKAIKSDYTFCRKSVVAPLLAQGLLLEGVDGLLDLKQL